MRIVIQRVNSASVSVHGRGQDKSEKIVGKIDRGLFVLVGVGENDFQDDAKKLAEKFVKLRVMADENGKMNLTVLETKSKILVVSQFTLYADTSKGNRPSFVKAAAPELANDVYKHFVKSVKDLGVDVETGVFGEYMKINIELDGPVTIVLEG